jgi:uncharacterized protein (DUF1330 family)
VIRNGGPSAGVGLDRSQPETIKMTKFVLPALGALVLALVILGHPTRAQNSDRPAFVIVERTATTGDDSIQQEYAKLAREILPHYGGHYLARSQNNTLLEGTGAAPCCMAVLEFPSIDAAKRWYASQENQSAAEVRQRGAKFRLVLIEGLPSSE